MGNFFVKLFLQHPDDESEVIENNILEEINDSSSESDSEEFEKESTSSSDIEQEQQENANNKSNGFFSKQNKNKRALLIGINYNKDQFKDDDLNGCVNDLNNLKKFLREKGGFTDDNIITLVNEEATKEAIEMEILNLSYYSFTNPGSDIWLSYSGHGAQISLYNTEKTCEIICPSDYIYNGIIKDTWLQTNFVRSLHKNTNAFVLMDCCNSGSNLNLPFRYSVIDRVSLHDDSYNQSETNKLCNIIKISGCEDDQTSADYFDRQDNQFQGALTNNFLDVFEKENDMNILNSYLNVILNIKNNSFTQRPVLSFTNSKLINYKLFE